MIARSPALWLALRELAARRGRLALAGAVVAALTATVTATELVARAREEAIAARIDAIGPALTVVPRGVSAGALARYELGEGSLPPSVEAEVRRALADELRAVERRLVVHREVGGARVPVVGVEASVLSGPGRPPEEAALGAELARRVGPVSVLSIGERARAVGGVRPSAGGPEDLAVFMPLEAVRALAGGDGVNELRLFLRAGVPPRAAEARLAAAGLEASVVRTDRGEVADREVHGSLALHRGVAYALMGGIAALCLLVAAHLDASERQVELATLVAIGASRWTVLGALLSRSALVAAAGAALGAAGGAILAVAQDPAASPSLLDAARLGATAVGAALALGAAAAAPTALAAAARDPVLDLQES